MKKKISIGACINVAFGLLLVLMLVIAVISYQISDRAESTGDQLYGEYGQTQGEVGLGFAYFQEVKCELRNILYLYDGNSSKQQEAIKAMETSQENMYHSFDMAKKDLTDEKALGILDEVLKNVNLYISDVAECIDCVKQGNVDEGRVHLENNGVDSGAAAADAILELIDSLDASAGEAEKDFIRMQETGRIGVLLMLVFSVLLCAVDIKYLLRQIKKPLVMLSAAAGKVAVGEISVDLPKECDLREIEELGDAFRQMTDTLQRQADVMNRISEGDLCAEITAYSEKDTVGTALAKLLQDDNHTFGAIRSATGEISHGSSQIAAASQTLAQGSTEQASAIEQISASVADIASKTKDNAGQADEVNRIVLQAKEDVVAGNIRMQEMVAAMEEINEASENIQKIIKVIDDIAFNTNILALNASVEAARAGEQGKGFAVVAEEVRSLAGRSAEASSRTEEMIEDSIVKVRRGGELAKETAEALQVISEMIEKITNLSEEIARSSNEQASATAQIDLALTQVSQVVQTNSATSQECAAASEQLSGQAMGLSQELSRFKLKKETGNMSYQAPEYAEPEINMLGDGSMY